MKSMPVEVGDVLMLETELSKVASSFESGTPVGIQLFWMFKSLLDPSPFHREMVAGRGLKLVMAQIKPVRKSCLNIVESFFWLIR